MVGDTVDKRHSAQIIHLVTSLHNIHAQCLFEFT